MGDGPGQGAWGVGLATTLKGFSLSGQGERSRDPNLKRVRTPGTWTGHREDGGSLRGLSEDREMPVTTAKRHWPQE